MDPITAMAIIGLIIVIGYIGAIFFKRTKIPDMLMLMFLGLLLGPVTGIIDTGFLGEFSSYIAALALIIIMFEGVGGFAYYVMGWDLLVALLLGAIVGGPSSAIVIPLLQNVDDQKLTTLLSLESALTDGIPIVVAFTIMQVLVAAGGAAPSIIVQGVVSSFSIGIVAGMVIGIVWLRALYVIKGHEYDYMLTLAILFLLYAGTEAVKGSGAIAVLIFGIVLGNAHQIGGIFRMKKVSEFPKRMRDFQHEITFFVKSFFFVYLGLLINITSLWTVFFGAFILIEIILARVGAVYLSFLREKMDKKFLVYVMMPRGLAAAVLSSLPLAYGIEHGAEFPDYVFMVIIGTAIVASVGMFYYESRVKPTIEKEKAKVTKQKGKNKKK
jgi:cell volume regulation protein A